MSTPQISRRNIAKGIAWTAPAITIAAAAPSLAASGSGTPGDGDEPVLVVGSSFAEKCQGASQIPGGWPKQGYRVQLTVSPADAPAPHLHSATAGNGHEGSILAGPTQVSPGVWEYAVAAGSSPSTLSISYSFDGEPTRTATIPARPHCGGK